MGIWNTWMRGAMAAVAVAGMSWGCRTAGTAGEERPACPAATESREEGARLFLMRWNPGVSSFTRARFAEEMTRLRRGEAVYMDWNAWDWRDIREGDWALWVRVGGGEEGIAGLWRLTGRVEEGASWRGDGKTLHYAWGRIVMMQVPSLTGILDAASLEKEFPEIDWRGGHAGVRVEGALAERLARHVANELAHARPRRNAGFAAEPSAKDGARCTASALLSNLCPEFLAELRGREPAIPRGEAPWLPRGGDCVVFDPAELKPGVRVEDVAHWVAPEPDGE